MTFAEYVYNIPISFEFKMNSDFSLDILIINKNLISIFYILYIILKTEIDRNP